MHFSDHHEIRIGEKLPSPFRNAIGIYQDGTTPMYRDTDGKLWAMSGHSHMGHIGMFCGTSLCDLSEVYPIQTNFCVGHADFAFSGIRYPEGVRARGSLWPFGLYICPVTHRFFCFFHNETGWNCKGTGYDALGPCETPAYDSDFRHVGLMHSDDEGRNWTFDRWVLTAEEVCFTEKYNPGAGTVRGQPTGVISLGSGDFSLYVEPEGAYIYLFYNIIRADMTAARWRSCDVYVARTRKRCDGVMGDFVKFYDGGFCEAGNLGKETAIARYAWHPRVVWLRKYGLYMMTASLAPADSQGGFVRDQAQVRFSRDLLHWSQPVPLVREGQPFGNHYIAAVSGGNSGQPSVVEGDTFCFLCNHNGTDVDRFPACIVEQEHPVTDGASGGQESDIGKESEDTE